MRPLGGRGAETAVEAARGNIVLVDGKARAFGEGNGSRGR